LPSPGPKPSVTHEYIYLSRQEQGYRAVINEEEVQAVMGEFGFQTVYPEKLDFLDQVELARNARILFGPQGSAFTLQIFMPPRGAVVEVFPLDRVHLFNRQVASVRGHRHYALLDSRQPQPKGLGEKSVLVNIEELQRTLELAVRDLGER